MWHAFVLAASAYTQPACFSASLVSPRASPITARVVNSNSEEAKDFKKQALNRPDQGRPVAAKERGNPKISYDKPDLASPIETFNALCRSCGVPESRDALLDFQGFVLAFEQLFNDNVPLDPDLADELHDIVLGVDSDEDEVSVTQWNAFHRKWTQATTMEQHLSAIVERRKAKEDFEEERERLAAELEQKEKDWKVELEKAKLNAMERVPKRKLLADENKEKAKKTGKWFEERESAARAAAAYRSLDPENWYKVTESIGGLSEPLEEIRRRIWTPLCAPSSLLEELGAERVKGMLLYGPPGCGKSYVAARLSAGLSRRPPTVVSGPEIMDKFVGGSEAQLRTIFTNPPEVPARPGDAADMHEIAENNELHVVVLDEFDAIARQRGDGSKAGDSATRDSVVNQLLVLMDGVSELPIPTFVLAMTNRRELVDNALLRPGRLEVHVEVGKPDEDGRGQILRIHAEKMRDSGRLALDGQAADGECSLERVDDATYDDWIASIAGKTEGFSGAAMAAVVRAAVARALDRSVSSENLSLCQVTDDDFSDAIKDVRQSSLELSQLEEEMEMERKLAFPNPIS